MLVHIVPDRDEGPSATAFPYHSGVHFRRKSWFGLRNPQLSVRRFFRQKKKNTPKGTCWAPVWWLLGACCCLLEPFWDAWAAVGEHLEALGNIWGAFPSIGSILQSIVTVGRLGVPRGRLGSRAAQGGGSRGSRGFRWLYDLGRSRSRWPLVPLPGSHESLESPNPLTRRVLRASRSRRILKDCLRRPNKSIPKST